MVWNPFSSPQDVPGQPCAQASRKKRISRVVSKLRRQKKEEVGFEEAEKFFILRYAVDCISYVIWYLSKPKCQAPS
jgi:hypothetical protein